MSDFIQGKHFEVIYWSSEPYPGYDEVEGEVYKEWVYNAGGAVYGYIEIECDEGIDSYTWELDYTSFTHSSDPVKGTIEGFTEFGRDKFLFCVKGDECKDFEKSINWWRKRFAEIGSDTIIITL